MVDKEKNEKDPESGRMVKKMVKTLNKAVCMYL